MGNVFVADEANHTIRKITPAGVVTTFAGLAGNPGSADGVGSAARFNFPFGVAVGRSGNVYVADSLNHTIRKITPDAVVSTLAGLAGSPGSADGTGSAARFSSPTGVAADRDGNVYVADYNNQTIRAITPDGTVSTLAGLAGNSGSADGTGSNARFYQPTDVAVDRAANVYVADNFNQTIRKVTPTGVVTTLAGFVHNPGRADGTGSSARFHSPSGIAADSAGNIYVGDSANYTIRFGRPQHRMP
jgi:sugar lactone lactonase YvrE